MSESLRARQTRMAGELIIEAFAAEVVEHGVNTSLQAVAERAGVSNRTLYNYFESRDRLVEGLIARVEQRTEELGGHVIPDDGGLIGDYTAANYRVWDEMGDLMRALVQIDAVSAVEGRPNALRADKRRAERLQFVDQDLLSLRPDLTSQQARTINYVLRSLTSSRTWHRLTIEDGVETETATTVVKWAWTTLRNAVADGRGPFDQAEEARGTPTRTTTKKTALTEQPRRRRPAKGRTP